MTIQTTLIASVALSVFTLSPVEAATWNAVSLGFTSDTAPALYKYSAAPFIDGQNVPFDPARGPTSFVLSDDPNISATPTTSGLIRNIITFAGGGFNGLKPPVVDTVSKTIDVSSIFFEAELGDSDCNFDPNSCDPRFPKLVWRGVFGGILARQPLSHILKISTGRSQQLGLLIQSVPLEPSRPISFLPPRCLSLLRQRC